MDLIPRILAAVSATLFFVGVSYGDEPSQEPAKTRGAEQSVTGVMVSTTQAPTTTTSVYIIPPMARCGQWWVLALEAGWQEEELETLDYIMWRESRCQPEAHNTTLNRDGSTDIGLTQVNDRSWCLPTRWYPNGYLQTIGVLANVGCEELFDPLTNLRAAKAIHDYAKETSNDGFSPWGV